MKVKDYKRNVRRIAKRKGLEIQAELEGRSLKFSMDEFILKVPIRVDLTSGKTMLTVPDSPEVPRPSDIVWGFDFIKKAQQIKQFEREGIVCR